MDDVTYLRERLREPSVNLREVAEGAGVGHSWLRMFARGKIPDPSYSRITALRGYFARGENTEAA